MEKKKLTKELLDSVRHIEGFPIGRDEDIIALSAPPYYTACPNPFIQDFIKEHGKPYDATDDYHREPFAADVTEGKNDPIYNAHSYHTKVPHKAIMRYILHYTEPGDIVFDGFCGTGMTGVAAQMCGNPDPAFKTHLVQEMGSVKWGTRKAILCDLSPVATFIAYNYNNPVDVEEFEREANRILLEVEKEYGWMYQTQHTFNGKILKDADGNPVLGRINYTVWSDVFVCPQCSEEVIFYNAAVEKEKGKVNKDFLCPHCKAMLNKRNMERAWVTKFDKDINETIRHAKQVPVLINYSLGNKRFEKDPEGFDHDLIDKIESMDIPYWYPTERFMFKGQRWGDTWRSGIHAGITHVHHFYTKRALFSLAKVFSLIEKVDIDLKRYILYTFEQSILGMSKIARYVPTHYSQVNQYLSGTLYIGSQVVDVSLGYIIGNKIRNLKGILNKMRQFTKKDVVIANQSMNSFKFLNDNSCDYVFTDPPFGDNLMYSELNFFWEAWLKVITNNNQEAIINKSQGKGLLEYRLIMDNCFKEMYRILKPGRWLTMVFHNSKNSIWNAIQDALLKAGFIVADVRVLNKKQGSFKQITTTSAMKEDLVVSAYKPKANFIVKFIAKAGTEEGVWEFVKQHLEQLPVVVTSDNLIEVLAERQNYMLYDRMVAFHLQNGYTIPMGAAEFYMGLHQRFPERDGMYFLPQQVPEYEQKRALAQGVGQLSLFIQDERSAIQWMRSKLENKLQTLAELTPQFLKEAKYVRWEKQLELSEILDQNFLQDEDGSWYVPDINKQTDLEKLREKALLREFELYKEGKGKLKLFRSESVRAGFKFCWKNKEYHTIVKVAQRIPESIIQDDVSLLMYYNNALTRTEG